jgi:hypothetical protein
MIFCGQCGLKLAPGDTTCPRCGSVTEPELVLDPQFLDQNINDPTIASAPHVVPNTPLAGTQRPLGTPTPPQQQKLVLHPDGSTPGFGAYAPNDPTSMMSARAPVLPPNPNSSIRTPYYGFTPPLDVGYQPPAQRGSGRVIALLVVLCVLLLILAGVAVFVVKPDLLKALIGNPTPVVTTPTPPPTPSDLARGVIQRYYDDINKHNYQDAYNLWAVDAQHPAASYDQFVNGFAHTLHDDITFNSITPLPDGTVQLDVMLHATEQRSSGTVVTPYHLFYHVGQQGGTWKILDGHAIS